MKIFTVTWYGPNKEYRSCAGLILANDIIKAFSFVKRKTYKPRVEPVRNGVKIILNIIELNNEKDTILPCGINIGKRHQHYQYPEEDLKGKVVLYVEKIKPKEIQTKRVLHIPF